MSSVQAARQLATAPAHTYAPQEGLPELPACAGEQVPTLPKASQTSQEPVQDVTQQWPFAQKPLTHSDAPEQVEPIVFFAVQLRVKRQ